MNHAQVENCEVVGNPGFETPAHRAEFAAWLSRRILPLKFAYTGSAAFKHDQLSRSSGYQHVIGPVQAEVQALMNASAFSGPSLQVVEIGPGNGVHSELLLRQLAERGQPAHRYLALDFSATLLDVAHNHLSRSSPGVPDISSGLWDIESGPSGQIDHWRKEGESVVVCLLGNTIGNVEDPQEVLSNIVKSTQSGDRLLLSATLLSTQLGSDALLEPYLTDVFRSAVLETFLLAHIDTEDVRLTLRLGDGAIFGTVEVLRPIDFDGVEIQPGEEVRCFQSRRFSKGDVRALLDDAGWLVVEEAGDDEHLVVVALRK